MLNEFAYCPRLFYLEWVQGEFRDSADTVDGRWKHRNVEEETGDVPEPEEGTVVHARSVMLSSDEHKLIARMDILEAEGRRATPVDYKRGRVPDDGPYEPECVQLCVQALILREKGYECDEGIVYYVESKRRVPVPIDDALVCRTLELAAQARGIAASGPIPAPLVDSPKCPRCSLVGICLPDEVVALSEPRKATREVRRLFPARDDAQPLYVQEQGATVGKSDERIVVKGREGKREVRLIDISQLSLFGNVTLSAQALRMLARNGIPICHFSYGGWFEAVTVGLAHKNVELRRRQFAVAEDAGACLALAREVVAAKIKNCRTLLRRNNASLPRSVRDELSRAASRAGSASDVQGLLGIEGAAARAYFGQFTGMLKDAGTGPRFDLRERNRRPPRDPVNAMLSFVYALLVKDMMLQAYSVGLDPYLGFYHRPRYGRPALALDLAEEFRPIVADSVVVSAINNGEVRANDFVMRGDACALSPSGRRSVIAAYERRMDTLIRHPALGYQLSYRRVFEVQARLLSRYLLGELASYPSFRTR